MNHTTTALSAVLLVALVGAAPALADYTITQGGSAQTYATTLNFDEPGGPTGAVPADSWASIGLADMQSGAGPGGVGDISAVFPWINDGNAFEAPFGVFMTFSTDLTALSLQVWDASGPPSFFGGGLNVILFNDGAKVWDLGAQNGSIATPAWGGLGDEWFDITTTDGMVFDEVRILGFGFPATTYVDNISWTVIPAPANAALFLLAGLGAARRRRA